MERKLRLSFEHYDVNPITRSAPNSLGELHRGMDEWNLAINRLSKLSREADHIDNKVLKQYLERLKSDYDDWFQTHNNRHYNN